MIHANSAHGEEIAKFVHISLHSLVICLIVKISYLYFGKHQARRAQIIAFILVSNAKDHKLWSELFNDQFMIMYLALTIYYLLENKPLISSFWVTVALSIKASPMLILPALLGSF